MREVYIFDRKELETWIENKEKATNDIGISDRGTGGFGSTGTK